MRATIIAACLLLAACGGGSGEDFAEDVNVSAQSAYADLSRLDGSELIALGGLPAIGRSAPEAGTVRYLLRSAEGHGEATVAFRVESLAPARSRVHVAIDLPEVEMKLDGVDKRLSEAKAETMLRTLLQGWAKDRNGGGAGSAALTEMKAAVGALALAISPGKIDGMKRLAAGGGFDLAEFADGDFAADRADIPDLDAPDLAYAADEPASLEPADATAEHESADWAE